MVNDQIDVSWPPRTFLARKNKIWNWFYFHIKTHPSSLVWLRSLWFKFKMHFYVLVDVKHIFSIYVNKAFHRVTYMYLGNGYDPVVTISEWRLEYGQIFKGSSTKTSPH